MAESKLTAIAAIITSLSAVAVPVIVAVIGAGIQKDLSQQAAGKDYTKMAVNILSNEATAKDPELRKWAVAVIDKTGPAPMSAPLRESLVSGKSFLETDFFWPQGKPDASLLKPPEPCDDKVAPDQQSACAGNAARLEALQKYVRASTLRGHEIDFTTPKVIEQRRP